jgi:hypothetical protein
VSPGLAGTGRIADDLWLLAHDDLTGKPFIPPRPLGFGLAAGLLAELALAGVLTVAGEQITVAARRRPPGDALAGQVLGVLAREREEHPVRDWLAYVGRTAPADVARRLEASGYLARASGVLPWRGRWVPADSDSAFGPVLRIRAAVDATQRPSVEAVVLAGLADGCGLWFRLAEYAPGRPVRPLYRTLTQLAPGLQALIVATRVAVDSAVLAHRV